MFASFVLRDELTNRPIFQTPLHVHWQDVLSKQKNVVLLAFVRSGKTQQVSIARVLWELGRNPRLRVVVLSATRDLSGKIAGAIRRYIESSEELHMVFPMLRPGAPWTGEAFNVAGASYSSKDYSVQVGFIGAHILGARYDLIVIDDALDWENTSTEYQRAKAQNYVESTVIGRRAPGARIWCLGNPWHPEDMLHQFAKRPNFYGRRWPVMDTAGNSYWPEQWPKAEIEAFRDEFPGQFRRQLMCEAFNPETARFSRTALEACKAAAYALGITGFVDHYDAGDGEFVVTGVDIGVADKQHSGLCVVFTVLVQRDGKRRILNIESGKGWTGPELIRRIVSAVNRYGALAYVESNAAQKFIVDFATEDQARAIRAFNTGSNKRDPVFGVESLATEIEQVKWLIPCGPGGVCHPEVSAWIDDCLYYNPAAHTGDRLMASWFAREAARQQHRNKPATMIQLDLARR